MTYEEMTQQHYNDLLAGAEDWAIHQVIDRVLELENENASLREYADKLADGLPCLPKDIEVLREANLGLAKENHALREALKEISTTAHCIAKAGPLNTPTLQDAWVKFMHIDAMATKALSK